MTELEAYRDARKYLIESQGELQSLVNELIRDDRKDKYYHYYNGRLEQLEAILEILENVDRWMNKKKTS